MRWSSYGYLGFRKIIARVLNAVCGIAAPLSRLCLAQMRGDLIDAGAHHVVATEEEDLVARVMEITDGQGARVVLDPVGGPLLELLAASMARGGILLQYGALSDKPTPFPLFSVLGKSLTLKGYIYSEIVSDDAALDRAKAFIVAGLESGALKPRIARTFPLDAIQDAHRFLESNEQIGKVVVTV